MNCDSSIYIVELAACPDNIIVKAGLAPLAAYFAQVTDKFNVKYLLGINSDEDGNLVVPSSIVPLGSFNPYAGSFTLRIFDANHSGLMLTFGGAEYEAVMFSFVETVDPDEYLNNVIQ